MKYMDSSNNNFYILVGLVTISFALWSVFYGIPSILFSLLHSLLGNLFLFFLLLLVAFYNPLVACIGLICVFLLIRVIRVGVLNTKEGFFTWTNASINKFIQVEDTVNQNRFFDIGFIQKHTSQEELDYFLKYNMWPWSTQTIQMYIDAINRNPYVQTYSKDSVLDARKVYPEYSILQVLALQSPEGSFLTNGVVINDVSQRALNRDGRGSYAYNSNQIQLQNRKGAKQVKCSVETGRPILVTGQDYQPNIYDLKDEDLPNVIPEFKYINEPCNVCDNMSGKNTKCAFQIFNQPTSSVWNLLWSKE